MIDLKSRVAEAFCTRTWGHTSDGIPCSACRKEAALVVQVDEAEVASLRQQLDEARGERDDLWRRFNSSQDSNKTLAAMAREELDLRTAAEADNARLLDVYRAAEAWREQAAGSILGAHERPLAVAVDSFRAGTPAEAPDGERA